MERLLDEADALVLTSDEPEPPNFDIPEEYAPYKTPEASLQLGENPSKGKGWCTTRDIAAGTILLVAKPVAMALDWQWDGGDDDDDEASMEENSMNDGDPIEDSEHAPEPQESQINEFLVLQVLMEIKQNPSVWTDVVSHLYPRTEVDVNASPVWISKDDGLFMQFEAVIQELEQMPELKGKTKEISARLPLIIRYNVLSVETCPELLSYPGQTGHSALSGVGLYYLPSFFNHDARPNVSRFAIGDVMWFVANQNIPAGTEACISYLEHDVLCESSHRRNLMLTLDFKEDEDPNGGSNVEEGPELPVIDSEVQNELMATPPFERLEAIEQLMQQASGEALPLEEQAEEDGMDADASPWYECDVHNLRILKAITLDSLGRSKEALPAWEESVTFTETKMPPNDESSIVMRTQAALCAWSTGEEARAREHAEAALRAHNVLFGGGVERFRRRYRKEFSLNLRPDKNRTSDQAMEQILWPLQQ